MLTKKRLLLAAGLAGATLFAASSAHAFWGPFNPWNWGNNGWGPGWGGPWYGPGYGYGYPGYGYGYPGYGYGYPGYGYGAPYAYGGYPYAYAYPGYVAPAQAAPTATTSSK
jgi:hypothetical protein